MSELTERLVAAAKQFPVIDENPEYLFYEAAQRIAELEARLEAVNAVESFVMEASSSDGQYQTVRWCRFDDVLAALGGGDE